jgi:integrase/recombinase XerD
MLTDFGNVIPWLYLEHFVRLSVKQAKVLNDAEFKRVTAVVAQARHADRNRMAVMFSFLAGMRACEIAALTVGSVIDSHGEPKNEIRLTSKMTKGDAGRVVVVSQRVRREITRYHATLGDPRPERPFLRSQKSGRAFSANTLVQLFGRIYEAAGLEGGSSHSGRRTFISSLASKGVSARVLQKLAGHSSLATTQRYIEVNDQMLRSAVELL